MTCSCDAKGLAASPRDLKNTRWYKQKRLYNIRWPALAAECDDGVPIAQIITHCAFCRARKDSFLTYTMSTSATETTVRQI